MEHGLFTRWHRCSYEYRSLFCLFGLSTGGGGGGESVPDVRWTRCQNKTGPEPLLPVSASRLVDFRKAGRGGGMEFVGAGVGGGRTRDSWCPLELNLDFS